LQVAPTRRICPCKPRLTGAICTTRTLTATICCDVRMFGDRTCECRADFLTHTLTWCNAREKWRTGRVRIKLIGEVVRQMCHEEIVVTVHGNSGATEVVSVRVAHVGVRNPVGGAYQSDIPSSFVASESSQCVDVQLNPELRCVKMRRIGSRVNVFTNVSRPLRSLPALGCEPAVCRARVSGSV